MAVWVLAGSVGKEQLGSERGWYGKREMGGRGGGRGSSGMEMGVEMRMGKRKREDEVEREGESGRVPSYPRGGG